MSQSRAYETAQWRQGSEMESYTTRASNIQPARVEIPTTDVKEIDDIQPNLYTRSRQKEGWLSK